jgi:hypothetical protein
MPSFGEDLVQVVLDRAGADEQSGPDLRVGEPVARQLRDPVLLGCQPGPRLGPPAARRLAGRAQLVPSPGGERLEPHLREQVLRHAQLLARLQPPPLAAQPLAVDEVRAGEVHAHTRAPERVDRLAVEPLGGLAFAEERSAPRRQPQRERGRAGLGRDREPLQVGGGRLCGAGPHGRFDQLDGPVMAAC